MALSNDLISQFVKITKDKAPDNSETIVYGTIQESKAPNGLNYVKIDGSDLLTPISSTTVVAANDRVTIMIKNHSAVVTGNLTSPAARSKDTVDVEKLNAQKARIDTLEASNVTIQGELEANSASINLLSAENATIKGTLNANVSDINTLKANEATISGKVTANEAAIQTLQATTITAEDVAATYATIENLNAQKGRIDTLESTYISSTVVAATYATIESLNAQKGRIDTLDANKLSAADIEGLYANIDFSNISKATMGQFYANSGLIQNVVVGDSTITGKLVGVTISGDLIEGNTVKAEKLVIKGTDGLYYKLNTDGVTTEAQQTNQNSLDGSVIKAKSIMATKVNVTDLVAFGATIGGFTITDSALYSGVKTSAVNTTRGIYLGKDAQAAIGDGTSYIKYYKDSDGNYKLAISADSIDLTSGINVQTQINALSDSVEVNSDDLTAYIAATNSKLDDLQGQVDGSIMTWFYEYVPTNSNIPASDWTTTALKNNHLGDLFYDTLTGYCYRWQVQNNTYSWNRITDVDVTKALADAAAAQDTADKKRRVFTATPTTPYDVGDLWAQGTSGELMRCKTAKTSKQSYAAADWEKASKYTDDTKANAAKSAADAAQADANALKTRMTAAETSITQNSEQIALRATKTEVTTAKEAAITAASTDATNKVNAIQVGGRNYVILSKLGSYANYNSTPTYSGNVITTTWNSSSSIEIFSLYVNGYSPDNDIYTISGYLKVNGEIPASKYFTGLASTYGSNLIKNEYDSSTGYFEITQKYVSTSQWLFHAPTTRTGGSSDVVTLTKLKFEKGNKATDWTPAPEDIDTSIADAKKAGTEAQSGVDALTTRVTAAETSITQNADAIALRATKDELSALDTRVTSAESSITIMANSIASNVSETTNLGTRTTTLEQTADGLTARMGTAEDDIATAQSTANTAKTNAATAQSTANTAKTNAATAQSTANTAKTNAATAQSTADAAKKTATNFISVDTTNGVLIGNKTSGSWVGTRAQITNSAFNILDSSGTILASYGTATLIGKTAGNNLYIDNDGLYIRKNGKVLVTVDQYGLKIANKNDSSGSLGSGTTKPALVIGTPTGYHIEMDNNEIMAKSNATTSSHLFLNMEGGNVSINNNASRALMFQDGALYAKNASYNNGEYLGIIDALNDAGNTTFGYGGYLKKIGCTNVYGNSISLYSNGNVDVDASWINCRSITPSDNATYALGTYGEKGWSNIYLGKGDGKTNALHIISGSSTYTLCGVNSSGQYIFGNNAAVMYYQVKNVSETATGNAFKVTSGNNTAANNTSSVWFFGAADATSRYIGSYLAYNRTYTSAANMVVTANGIFGRSTSSSQRYKKDISVADIDELKGLYDLPVKKFKYKDDYIAADDELYDKSLYGFVVEDLENVLPCAVQHEKDTDGTIRPEMWNNNIIVPSLLKLIQDLNNRLKVLEKKGD